MAHTHGADFIERQARDELKANTITANTCGVKGPTDGNTLKDNTFEANIADVCF